ncbi:MAG: cytoskeleton protein RodZ [Chthoniobacter sp.]|jgi:cytoskeletal protein RodZ|nr:cytoskeleton protein RodZ [Chthoniobacter sp.]
MVETVGRKLQQARQRRQISVEQAARATRMRPDKISDLEKDNYTNFPNMTYAKGFLVIYAKFLNVDVSDFAETLASTNPVGVEDYEYLNAHERRQPGAVYRMQTRNLWPVFTLALVLAAAFAIFYFFLTLKRIAAPVPVAVIPSAAANATPSPPAAEAVASPAPTAEAVASPSLSAAAAATASPLLSGSNAATRPFLPISSANTAPAAAPKDIVLKPLKKTWVTVRKDVADSPPVFDDWLFPDARALKFRGVKFWIEVKDPTGVEITRDGQPVVTASSSVKIE